MGLCLPCLQGESNDYDDTQPDPETRRKQQAEAALKRQHEDEARGLKDPVGVKLKQQRMEELERRAEQQPNQGGEGLRWQVG